MFKQRCRNFNWVTRVSAKQGKKKRKRVAEAIVRSPLERDSVSANQFVTQMLAASLGLKLFDAFRRILLYTKPYQDNKSFYAICRGIFPIHELCGTMTAIALAKRDLLGVNMPLWKLLGPAVVIHGMANFRGMKVRSLIFPASVLISIMGPSQLTFFFLSLIFTKAHFQVELSYSLV